MAGPRAKQRKGSEAVRAGVGGCSGSRGTRTTESRGLSPLGCELKVDGGKTSPLPPNRSIDHTTLRHSMCNSRNVMLFTSKELWALLFFPQNHSKILQTVCIWIHLYSFWLIKIGNIVMLHKAFYFFILLSLLLLFPH